MSDDLVKRLRRFTGLNAFTQEPVQNKLNVAAADRIEELEAKLEKAVAQMQRVKDFRYDPNIGIELNLLEATLAELKGEI